MYNKDINKEPTNETKGLIGMTMEEMYKTKWEEATLKAEALEDAAEEEEAYYVRGFAKQMYIEYKKLQADRKR